jgi:hypothetical protein
MNKPATEQIYNLVFDLVNDNDWKEIELKEVISSINLEKDILIHYEPDEILKYYTSDEILDYLNDDDIISHVHSNYDQKQLIKKLDIEIEDQIKEQPIYDMYRQDVIDRINEISEKTNFLKLLNYLNKYEI